MVRPYPFERLPRMRKAEAAALRGLRSALGDPSFAAGHELAEQLLGKKCSISAGLPEIWTPTQLQARLRAPTLAAVLEQGAGGPRDCLVLECTPATAAYLADRVLGAEDSVVEAPLALDDLSSGAFAYLLARVLSAAGASCRLRSFASDPVAIARVFEDETLVVLPVELRVQDRSCAVRVFSPVRLREPLTAAGAPPLPAWLRPLPVTLVAVAGDATLRMHELASLRVGDVVLLDHSALERGPQGFTGSVQVRIRGSRAGFLCHAAAHALTIEETMVDKASPRTQGAIVSESPENNALSTFGSDAPVELSVTLAHFVVSFEELGRLRAGDVLSSGRAIGEAVTLEAAGRTLAEGELVDVDGEIGVRILRLVATP